MRIHSFGWAEYEIQVAENNRPRRLEVDYADFSHDELRLAHQ